MLWQPLNLFLLSTLPTDDHRLQPFLRCDVALNDFLRDVPSGGGEIAPRPEGGEPTQYRILLAEVMGRESLALFNHGCCRVGGPDTEKEMDMIGLQRAEAHFCHLRPSHVSRSQEDAG